MCLISVPNLKKIDPREGCFLAQNFLNQCEEENVKKIGQFLEIYIWQIKVLSWFSSNLA